MNRSNEMLKLKKCDEDESRKNPTITNDCRAVRGGAKGSVVQMIMM